MTDKRPPDENTSNDILATTDTWMVHMGLNLYIREDPVGMSEDELKALAAKHGVKWRSYQEYQADREAQYNLYSQRDESPAPEKLVAERSVPEGGDDWQDDSAVQEDQGTPHTEEEWYCRPPSIVYDQALVVVNTLDELRHYVGLSLAQIDFRHEAVNSIEGWERLARVPYTMPASPHPDLPGRNTAERILATLDQLQTYAGLSASQVELRKSARAALVYWDALFFR